MIGGSLYSRSSKLDEFEKSFLQAKLKFQQGDSLLTAKNIAGALGAYFAGRKILNDSFFALMMARHQDSLSTDTITASWDSAVAIMRHKLDGIDDCEFDRCYIYKEEKAANACLEILESNDSLAIANMMLELEQLFHSDENMHLKDFFGKIYNYIHLQNNLITFQSTVFPDSSSYNHNHYQNQCMKFIKMYRNYLMQLKQNKR